MKNKAEKILHAQEDGKKIHAQRQDRNLPTDEDPDFAKCRRRSHAMSQMLHKKLLSNHDGRCYGEILKIK